MLKFFCFNFLKTFTSIFLKKINFLVGVVFKIFAIENANKFVFFCENGMQKIKTCEALLTKQMKNAFNLKIKNTVF